MNIAFFHELHFGGAKRVVSEYADIFKKYHKTALYYVDSQKDTDIEGKFHEALFTHFTKQTYEGNDWKIKLYIDFIQPIRLYFLHKKLAKQIDEKKYDFIFVHPSQFTHAPYVLRFLKTPTMYYCQEPLRIAHDPVLQIPQGLSKAKKAYEVITRKIKKLIDTSNIRKADVVITNSDYSKTNIKKAYNIHAYTSYLGVNCKTFRPIEMKKTIDILFVGAPVWMEGYDTLQEIIALFKTPPRVFIVKGEKGKFMPDKELMEKYNASKIVVILGRFDPFTMIPLEGNACGIPAIGVKEGGTIEAIEDGYSGYLLDRDRQKLYEKIHELLSNETLRNKLGKQGRERDIKFWNWEKSYERCMKIVVSHLLS